MHIRHNAAATQTSVTYRGLRHGHYITDRDSDSRCSEPDESVWMA